MNRNISAKPEKIDVFASEFKKFESEAFRFELIQDFSVPDENESFRKFLGGQNEPDASFNLEWKTIIEAASERGAFMNRVRKVQRPVSKYLHFEFLWGYRNSLVWGEKIRVVDAEIIDNLAGYSFLQDYWVFDDERVYLMEYNDKGEFLGVQKVNPGDVKYFINLKEQLLKVSRPLTGSQIEEIGNLSD